MIMPLATENSYVMFDTSNGFGFTAGVTLKGPWDRIERGVFLC